MNPVPDALYRIHQFQAARRGQSPLAYETFRVRMPATYETDLTGLLLPAVEMAAQPPMKGEPKFELGQICITSNVASAVPSNEVILAVARHVSGDWGTLDEHDRKENERALGSRGRLVSMYQASNGTRFWVITDSGWGRTSVLLSEDY